MGIVRMTSRYLLAGLLSALLLGCDVSRVSSNTVFEPFAEIDAKLAFTCVYGVSGAFI